jgi:hypothetical protein
MKVNGTKEWNMGTDIIKIKLTGKFMWANSHMAPNVGKEE